MDAPPSGTVTFLFTDIEGSTLLLERLGPAWGATLDAHDNLLRAAIEGAGGQQVNTSGDAVFAVFARPPGADDVGALGAAHMGAGRSWWLSSTASRTGRVALGRAGPGVGRRAHRQPRQRDRGRRDGAARRDARLRAADAESLRAVVDRSPSASRSFMALSQGFVALGLVIGVGGLSVVMIRAVRERRRQIGMLRAMGLPARTVRRAFVLESGFVAARGLLIGGGLALLSCWLLASRSDALGERGIPFSAPWGTLSLCSRSRSSRPWRPRRSPPRERHASGRRWPSEWANEEPGGATPQGSAAF